MDESKMTKEWVTITDEEIKEMNYIRDKYGPGSIVVHVWEEYIDGAIDLFRVLEAKLKERNNNDAAIKAERERCAKLCEESIIEGSGSYGGICASVIRTWIPHDDY